MKRLGLDSKKYVKGNDGMKDNYKNCTIAYYLQARCIADQNQQQNAYQEQEGGRENWSGKLV